MISNSNSLRQLGKSDLRVSSVAMGCWPIAKMTSLDVNDADSLKTLRAAEESGINFFDTAHCYGADGISERLVGSATSDRPGEFVVATKCGVHWEKNNQTGGFDKVVDGTAKRLRAECMESLSRLSRESIDLMYLHQPDPTIPIEDSAGALAEMKQEGLIREVGVSNCTVDQMAAFHAVCPIVAMQPPFNMLQQQIRKDVVPWCEQNEVSIINYWPLMKGLLAGKIRRDHKFDPQDKRLTYEIFQGEQFEHAQNLLDQLEKTAQRVKCSLAQLVIAWNISRPFITSALCGAKRDWQIEETAAAMNVEWTDELESELESLVSEFRTE